MEITKTELKSRMGYLLLGFFSLYLVGPISEWINTNLSINPLLVGAIGLAFTLYFFEFK
jgi:hypothetical protein